MHLIVDFDDTLVTDTLETTLPIVDLERCGRPRRRIAVRPYIEQFFVSAHELFDSVRLCSYSPQAFLEEFVHRCGFQDSIHAAYGRELLEGQASMQLEADFVVVDDMPFNHELLIRKFAFFGLRVEDPPYVRGCNLNVWRAERGEAFRPITQRLIQATPFTGNPDDCELLRVTDELRQVSGRLR